jgi:uncharacterized protein
LSDLFHDSIWWVSGSVFVAGLIGSPHCLSMCGPIAFSFSSRPMGLVGYQLGRLFSYTLAGAGAAVFGGAVFGVNRPDWLADLSLLLIALLLVVNGYRAIVNRPIHIKTPKFINRIAVKLWRRIGASNWPTPITATLAGILTVFLPCGHLYSFLVGAIAAGSAVGGALFMAAFWLGSTPLMSVGGIALQKFLKVDNGTRQRWVGVILVGAGLFSVLAFGARTNFFGKPRQDHVMVETAHEQMGLCH